MKLMKAGFAGLLAIGLSLASANAVAAERITVNIGSSHPVQNIWVWAMKNVFQPEVDRILAESRAENTKSAGASTTAAPCTPLPTPARQSRTASSTLA